MRALLILFALVKRGLNMAVRLLFTIVILPTLLVSAVLQIAEAGSLNDTGITFCGAYPTGNNAAPCTPNPVGQDMQYGRDAAASIGALTKIGGGLAGFDFTKVCMSGELAGQGSCPDQPSIGTSPDSWACTKDNVTGLIWEVKLDDGGIRDKDNVYTNFDDVTKAQVYVSPSYKVNPTQAQIDSPNNSVGYVNSINALTGENRLCGATDWRLPSVKELEGIVNYSLGNPYIDISYFPNTPGGTWIYFLTKTPSAEADFDAWVISFDHGNAGRSFSRRFQAYIRLVREVR